MDINIRQATPGDFDKIYALINEFAKFIQTPEKVLTSPTQMREDQDYFRCFIAVEDDKIIGFATWFIAYFSWTGKVTWLDDLYVTESYRGHGIGNLLLDRVIETAKAVHCRRVRWQVSKWNAKAIEFYKKRGASIDDVEINCDLIL